MSRRSRSRAAFSLFSFQDIITAVTAIVILLVLILTLELITRRQQAAAADPGVGRAALEETIAELDSLVGRLAAAAPTTTVQSLAARTRDEVERDEKIIRDQASRAADRAAAARVEERRARELAAAEAARLAALRADQGEVVRTGERATALEAEAEALARDNQRQAARLAKKPGEAKADAVPGAEIVFNASREKDRQAWIVELSGAGTAVVKLGTGRRQDLGHGAEPGTPLARWLVGLDRRRDHALLLLRPSGLEELDGVWDALADAGIPFGIDLIGEEQVVRDGRGEARAAEGGG
jgi:hypothetical protein